MSKEYLDAFDRITLHTEHDNDSPYDSLNFEDDCKLVDNALNHLEAIDNANPSEALECLEDIYRNAVFISDYDIFGKQHTTNISPETNKSISVQCDIIKQALLKAQESKKYLKWKDLEFKETEQTMKVLLNGEEYKLSYFTDGITEYVDLLAGNGKYQMGRYVDCYPTDVKFFNDLHLEEILKKDKSE